MFLSVAAVLQTFHLCAIHLPVGCVTGAEWLPAGTWHDDQSQRNNLLRGSWKEQDWKWSTTPPALPTCVRPLAYFWKQRCSTETSALHIKKSLLCVGTHDCYSEPVCVFIMSRVWVSFIPDCVVVFELLCVCHVFMCVFVCVIDVFLTMCVY